MGSYDKNIYGINASNGSPKWTFSTNGQVTNGVASANGVAYVGSSDFYLYAINVSNGSLTWKFKEEAPVEFGTPAVVNGVVYTGDDTGHFYALNASTGAKLWSFSAGSGIASRAGGGERHRVHRLAGAQPVCAQRQQRAEALVVSDGLDGWRSCALLILVAVSPEMARLPLDAGNGSFKWKFSTAVAVEASPGIAVTQNIVYPAQQWLGLAINGGNREAAWKFSTGGACSSPAVAQ